MRRTRFNRMVVLLLLVAVGLPVRVRGQDSLQVPVCLNFNTMPHEQPAAGWTRMGANNSSLVLHYMSGEKHLHLMIHDTDTAGRFTLSPPVVGAPLNTLLLSLRAYGFSHGCSLEVYTAADTAAGTPMHVVDTILLRSWYYHEGQYSTHNWTNPYQHYLIDLQGAPAGDRYVAFRPVIDTCVMPGTIDPGASHEVWIDDFLLTDCGFADFHVVRWDGDTALLRWTVVGTPTLTLTVRDETVGGEALPMAVDGDSANVGGLVRGHRYVIGLHAACAADSALCHAVEDSVRMYAAEVGRCVDATNFFGDGTHCYIGTYMNPARQLTRPCDFGLDSSWSRHLVITDTLARDTNTGGALRMVPPGEAWSVRLGNPRGGWDAEAIEYRLKVDTAQGALLILRYAAVLYDESRSQYGNKPFFFIDLLDSLGRPLDSLCTRRHFRGGANTGGWNHVWHASGMDPMQNPYCYCDWWGMAVDLAPWQGQNVRLRLATADDRNIVRKEPGYAYFSVDCRAREERLVACEDSVLLEAPGGFRYRWTDSAGTLLSTQASLTVPPRTATYFCVLEDKAMENCGTVLTYCVYQCRHERRERRVCADAFPMEWEGYTFGKPDSVTFTLTDSHGADSVVTLVLTADSAVHARAFHSVDGLQWADTTPIVLCSGQRLMVSDSTQWATEWLWSAEIGATAEWSHLPSSEFVFDGIDTVVSGYLTLEARNTSCSDTLRWRVAVLPSPKADFSWFPEPVDMDPETEFLNASEPVEADFLWLLQREQGGAEVDSFALAGPFRYRWPGDLPQGGFDVELQASLACDFLLDSVKMHHVCTDTTRLSVTIASSYLQFPNLVTPNGDGVNDRWRIVNLLEYGLYSMNELWIYSRWGNLVYHVRDIHDESQFWNPDDPFCPDGTYFFRFSAKSLHGLIRLNGTIEVVR